MEKVSLTLDGWRGLETLAKHGGRMTTLRRDIVRQLVRRGLAEKSGDWVVITDKGRAVV